MADELDRFSTPQLHAALDEMPRKLKKMIDMVEVERDGGDYENAAAHAYAVALIAKSWASMVSEAADRREQERKRS